MNNETATATKAAEATEKDAREETSPKQPASKPEKSKPSTDPTTEQPVQPETAPEGTVFRVDANGGPLRNIKIKDAIKEILETKSDTFTKEAIETAFTKGNVIPSEFFKYSTKAAKLKKFVKELPEVKPEVPMQAKQGDVVFHLLGGFFGEVIDADGKLMVHFVEDGSKKSRVYKADRWRIATPEETEGFRNPVEALEPTDVAPPVEAPLTKDEKKELQQREKEIATAYDQYEKAPFIIGANLREIFAKRLNREYKREDGKAMSNGDYAFAKFGITRSYAQNLVQLTGFTDIALEAIEDSDQVQFTVNTANQLARATNRLAKGMGADDIKGFAELTPIIQNTMQLLVDTAPKDADGKPIITPRLINSFNEKIAEFVSTDVVNIDGKAMKISEAREKGLLSTGIQAEILEHAAEGIKTNWETIKTETRRAYEVATAPADAKVPATSTAYWTGEVPVLGVECGKHGEVQVASIGNGTFQTTCKCRWRIDNASGDLVCWEVRGKLVKKS